MRKLLFTLFAIAFFTPLKATEPLGFTLQQTASIASTFYSESPLYTVYGLSAEWREPFYSIDSLAQSRRCCDFLRTRFSSLFSPHFIEVKGAFFISPLAPLELGGFFGAQVFPTSNSGLKIDSLPSIWNEGTFNRRTWDFDKGIDFFQVAAFVLSLRGELGRLYLEATWTTTALDVNTGEGSGVYYYGWDLPVQHGDNVVSWELIAEYAFGTVPREEAWKLGSHLSLVGAGDGSQLFFDPRPASSDVAQLRNALWLDIPLSKRWRARTTAYYNVHSQGGGTGKLSERLGYALQLSWRWHYRNYSLR